MPTDRFLPRLKPECLDRAADSKHGKVDGILQRKELEGYAEERQRRWWLPTWLDQGHFVQQPLEDVELASPIGALLVYLIKARNRSGGWMDEEYRLI